jgi:glycosyltransferase involved in cell wall biosynthesis
MIVRNEENSLPCCLASVRGLFDEIIIVDTGSTDRTKGIAQWFGANVFDFEWRDDFAAARNCALDHATGDYVFWLDADDVIEPAERVKLKTLLDAPPDPGAAYAFPLVLDQLDGSMATPGGQVRLFPRIPELRWEFRVHEIISRSIVRSGIPIRGAGIKIRHTGYADAIHLEAARARDERIVPLMLSEHSNDAYVLFRYGDMKNDPKTILEAIHRWTPELGVALSYMESAFMRAWRQSGLRSDAFVESTPPDLRP